MNIQLDVSEEILHKYNLLNPAQLENVIRLGVQQLQIEEALTLYHKGVLSLWKAATIAGIPLREMLTQAAARGYEPEIDEKMLGEELT
jgi:predicted HTH domain antitoxin